MSFSNPKWLVTGASGQLGGHVVAQLIDSGFRERITAVSRHAGELPDRVAVAACELCNLAALADCLEQVRPTHIIHLGAVTAVGDAYRDPAVASVINTDATSVLAHWAGKNAARLVFASTDMVFDGEHAPYCEEDQPEPLSHYGRTKAAGERAIAGLPGVLTVRLPLMYGFPIGPRATTFTKQIAALRSGEPLTLFTDEHRTPIALRDAARALVALAQSDLSGVIHVAGPERLSRYDMVARFAEALAIANAKLLATSRLAMDSAEPRPADLSLNGDRFNHLMRELAPGPICRAALVPTSL